MNAPRHLSRRTLLVTASAACAALGLIAIGVASPRRSAGTTIAAPSRVGIGVASSASAAAPFFLAL